MIELFKGRVSILNRKELLKQQFITHIYNNHSNGNKFIIMKSLEIMFEKSERITGFLRLQTIKKKLTQAVGQSLEIKTGDLIEAYFNDVFYALYGVFVEKNEVSDNEGPLKCDLLFKKDDIVYVAEVKIRDDHDNSKIEGQTNNLKRKIEAVKQLNSGVNVFGFIWFIDNNFHKHETYFRHALSEIGTELSCDTGVLYGSELLEKLNIVNEWSIFKENYLLLKNEFATNLDFISEYDFQNDPDGFVIEYLINKRWVTIEKIFFSDKYRDIIDEVFVDMSAIIEKLKNYYTGRRTKVAREFLSNI